MSEVEKVSTDELFEKAVREHSRRLLTIARAIVGNRFAAEDVLQQALLNLYQHRHRYDWREPGGLLRRTVVNEALRLLRQRRLAPVADDHPGDEADDEQHLAPLDRLIGNEAVARVREAIDRLPQHFRAALVLCEYEKLSYTQISEALGATVPQVKTWLHRARRQLAKMLSDLAPDKNEERPPSPDDARNSQTSDTRSAG